MVLVVLYVYQYVTSVAKTTVPYFFSARHEPLTRTTGAVARQSNNIPLPSLLSTASIIYKERGIRVQCRLIEKQGGYVKSAAVIHNGHDDGGIPAPDITKALT
jgi:hypothetical protein